MRVTLAAAVAASALLAGCASGTLDILAPQPASPLDAFLAAGYSAEDCVEGALALLVEPAAAKALLPEGFAPGDAGAFFGLGLSSGRAVMYLNAQRCETTTRGVPFAEAEVSVYLAPPANAELEPAFDFYELTFVMEDPAIRATFEGVGWNGSEGVVSLDASMLPEGGRASGGASDENGSLFEFDVATPGENPLDGIGRFWRVVNGTALYVEHRLTTTLMAGGATCALREGSPAAEALGRATCRPGDAVGVLLRPFAYDATFHAFGNATAP